VIEPIEAGHAQAIRTLLALQDDPNQPCATAERWRGLRFTEFELRQLTALRKELDEEYQASIMSPTRSSQPRFSSKSTP
jgi:hypothetical protein